MNFGNYKTIPYITSAFIAISCVATAFYLYAAPQAIALDIMPTSMDLLKSGHWFTAISSVFVHASLVHLLSNILSLIAVGFVAENIMGAKRYALLCFVGAILATAFHIFITPIGVCGISGVIFAIMGYLLITYPKEYRNELFAVIVFNLIYGATSPLIAIWAHVGGLIAGLAYGFGGTIYDRRTH